MTSREELLKNHTMPDLPCPVCGTLCRADVVLRHKQAISDNAQRPVIPSTTGHDAAVIEMLRRALVGVQWAGRDRFRCIECGGQPSTGHERNCLVGRALSLPSTGLPAPAPETKRWPAKGDQMKFLGQNGYDFELEAALKIFTPGQIYRVHDCNVQSWSHSVQFDGVKGWYNGVMFELCPTPQQDRGGK